MRAHPTYLDVSRLLWEVAVKERHVPDGNVLRKMDPQRPVKVCNPQALDKHVGNVYPVEAVAACGLRPLSQITNYVIKEEERRKKKKEECSCQHKTIKGDS